MRSFARPWLLGVVAAGQDTEPLIGDATGGFPLCGRSWRNRQDWEHIRFVHMLRRPLFVLADILHDISQFLRDQRLMGVFHQNLIRFQMADKFLLFQVNMPIF